MAVRRLVAIALAIAVVSAGFVATTSSERVLVVEDAETGERLVTVPVDDGATVTLAYTHSVEKTPVEDVYTVDGTNLDNTLMRFKSYGWGLPSRENVTLRNGWFVFDPERSYSEVYVKPGRIADHTLRVDGTAYDLVELSNASSVRITVIRRTPLSGLFR